MMTLMWWGLLLGAIGVLSYQRASLYSWTLIFLGLLALYTEWGSAGLVLTSFYWIVFLGATAVFTIRPIRRRLITRHILRLYRRMLPTMSTTEEQALLAGTVSWEGELFRGNPHWQTLLSIKAPQFSEEEKAFIEGPVKALSNLLNDWEITHERCDLSPKIWTFLKEKGFFALIIPKAYGGLEFSAYAHAEILVRINSRSHTAGAIVAVPNSLGPAELLLKYGTDKQKDHYLPRLAKGEEVPCFALTSPDAGSDAGAIPDSGIVCKAPFEGQEITGIRLNWDKRYITLAPVATLLGLAFKLYDPDHLLSDQTERGITCALIPTTTPGITIGRRHFPLNNPFQNGPTQGKDVFIPLDWIIGGIEMAGQGWRMLVECLSVGRAISLPASAVGGAKLAALSSGAYARIRRQFKLPIGHFEGIEEALARIGGNTYLMDAATRFTTSLIDQGEKPAVPSAIVKYHTTERARRVAIDAMDIHGGKAICLGPRNYLGRAYQGAPISITVEGANILTRSMIIFGQGAVRCHPYILAEMQAANHTDKAQGFIDFDKHFFGHLGFTISNFVRTLILSLSQGRLVCAPKGANHRYFQQLTRLSAGFALAVDVTMYTLGGSLKRREKISARLGDILSCLYLASAVLKRHHDDGEPAEDQPFVDWACRDLIYMLQQQFYAFFDNFPQRPLAWFMRLLIFPLGRRFKQPSDQIGHKISQLLLSPTAARARLTEGMDLEPSKNNPVGVMEALLPKIINAEPLEKLVQQAQLKGLISAHTYAEMIEAAVVENVLTREEADEVLEVDHARREVIAVDDFSDDELLRVS